MKLIVSCLIAAGLASTFCAGSARATEITDHFDDGVIDPSIWAVGGSKRGTDGYNGGTWNWSVTEIPGSINLRVWGPPMANTYGSEAWMKTQHNFNDGSNYTINFTWGFTANAYHIDYVAFQITDGSIVIDNNYAWYRDGAPGTHNIFSVYSSGPSPDYGMVNTPPTAWSILLDSTNRQATVYNSPNGTGSVVGSGTLNSTEPWYLRFITTDATSMGFPGGNDTFYVCDFSARSGAHPVSVPDEMPTALALVVVVGALAISNRIRTPASG